ncbi:MAG: hypothetical protein LAQ69_37655 [Acidobacteriia bacterium]|nr:hypothetical protein [Terriglobia bacterium]
MNRKLLLLDVVLVAVVFYVGVQFRNEWRAAKAREAATLNRQPKPLPPPIFTPLPPEPAVMPSAYINVTDKLLFDRSRNATVVIEVPPPPPPKPMPALPAYHGMMNLGSSGPTAFFSVTADAPHQAIHIGESIGQFKLLSVNSEEIALEWDGKVIHRAVGDLAAHSSGNAPQVAQNVRTEAAPPPQAAPPPAPASTGPGEATAFGFKTCTVNDGNAEGSVKEGYRKVMHSTPFGQSCTWEPVGK